MEEDSNDDHDDSESISPKQRELYTKVKFGILGVIILGLLWELIDREPEAILINDLINELYQENVRMVYIYRKHGPKTFYYAIVHLRTGARKTLYLGFDTESLVKLLRRYGVNLQRNNAENEKILRMGANQNSRKKKVRSSSTRWLGSTRFWSK